MNCRSIEFEQPNGSTPFDGLGVETLSGLPGSTVLHGGYLKNVADHGLRITDLSSIHASIASEGSVGTLEDELLFQTSRAELAEAERDYANFRADRDPLTGALSRQGTIDGLRSLLTVSRLAANNAETATVIMVTDADKFKPINDKHGHAAGDAVLRLKAELLSKCLRLTRDQPDVLGRWGGDEFVIGLGQVVASKKEVKKLVNALRHRFNEIEMSYGKTSLSIGVSIGAVAVANNSVKLGQSFRGPVAHEDEVTKAIIAADLALHAEKTRRQAGR